VQNTKSEIYFFYSDDVFFNEETSDDWLSHEDMFCVSKPPVSDEVSTSVGSMRCETMDARNPSLSAGKSVFLFGEE
jgi:hypothetical protein